VNDAMKAPEEYEVVAENHSRFQGRNYYGAGAADRAELDYLRAWKRWAEGQLKVVRVFIETHTRG
jgi:hypothetical protein